MKIRTLLALIGTGLIAAQVSATEITFSYSDSVDGITANGTLTTSGGLISNVGGTGYSGYEITGITGVRNGQAITGLIPNASFPDLIIFENAQLDNALLNPLGLDFNGFAFNTVDGTFNLYATDGNPADGYSEFAVGSDPNIIHGIDLVLEATSSARPVPDGGNTLMLLGSSVACLGFAIVRKKKFGAAAVAVK